MSVFISRASVLNMLVCRVTSAVLLNICVSLLATALTIISTSFFFIIAGRPMFMMTGRPIALVCFLTLYVIVACILAVRVWALWLKILGVCRLRVGALRLVVRGICRHEGLHISRDIILLYRGFLLQSVLALDGITLW
jgi:hypothetical protein